MNKWTYRSSGGLNFPVRPGDVWGVDGHRVACLDLTRQFDGFRAHWPAPPKLIYTDPPWNNANVSAFYTKAGYAQADSRPSYDTVCAAVLAIAGSLQVPAWMEASVHETERTRRLIETAGGRIVARVPTTYYRRHPALLYQVTWGLAMETPADLHGADDEHTPYRVIAAAREQGVVVPGDAVLDPCLGRGLTLAAAVSNGLTIYGSELSPYRASASLTRLRAAGFEATRIGVV